MPIKKMKFIHAILSKRMLVVFILGFSSGLPLGLLTSTLQAWFADSKISLYITGMLSLTGLPYLYKFLWAPILDRYSLFAKLGRRRSWIIITQVILCVGFNLMAWMSPQVSPINMAILAYILASASATQDAAIDAYRIEILHQEEFGLGASFGILGYRLAMLVSGGVALLIAQYVSWSTSYHIMGLLMLLGILATLWGDERDISLDNKFTGIKSTFVEPLKDLFKRKGVVAFCLFVTLFKLGEAFTITISGIVMPFLIQGLGFSVEKIAYINKIIGVLALIAGGLSSGFILLRYSLFKSLLVFGLIQSLTNLLFVGLAIVGKNTILLSIAVICDNFAGGLGSTAITVLLMRFVNCRFTATQFAILAGLSSLPRIFSGPIGAFLQDHLGWVGLYQTAFVASFFFIPFLFKIANLDCFRGEVRANN